MVVILVCICLFDPRSTYFRANGFLTHQTRAKLSRPISEDPLEWTRENEYSELFPHVNNFEETVTLGPLLELETKGNNSVVSSIVTESETSVESCIEIGEEKVLEFQTINRH